MPFALDIIVAFGVLRFLLEPVEVSVGVPGK